MKALDIMRNSSIIVSKLLNQEFTTFKEIADRQT